MIERQIIKEIEGVLISQIDGFKKEILTQFNPETYIQFLENSPENPSYRSTSEEVRQFYDMLFKESNKNILETFHQLILVKLIAKNQEVVKEKYPDSIVYWFDKNFNRIIKTIKRKPRKKGFFLYPNDNFYKDLSVCCLRMIPAGLQKIHTSGFSRDFIFKDGILQAIQGIIFYFFKAGTNEPFYQMHTDTHDLDLLKEMRKSADGAWEHFYLNVASLLRQDSRVKGLYGGSWMNDPQLERISPSIFYGAKLAIENGAGLFRGGTTAHDLKMATHASSKRKALHKKGKYIPGNYLLIWPRKQLLAWADNFLKA